MIQSARIYIRVASFSLVSFRRLSALVRGWLISYINIYHLFTGFQDIISFFLSSSCLLEFSLLEVKTWHFLIQRWRNLTEEPSRIFATQDRWSVPLKYVSDILQTEEAFTVEEYTHSHIHTHKDALTRARALPVP